MVWEGCLVKMSSEERKQIPTQKYFPPSVLRVMLKGGHLGDKEIERAREWWRVGVRSTFCFKQAC